MAESRRDAAGVDKAADISEALAQGLLARAKLLTFSVPSGTLRVEHGLKAAYQGALLVAAGSGYTFHALPPDDTEAPKKYLYFGTNAPASTKLTVLVF